MQLFQVRNHCGSYGWRAAIQVSNKSGCHNECGENRRLLHGAFSFVGDKIELIGSFDVIGAMELKNVLIVAY